MRFRDIKPLKIEHPLYEDSKYIKTKLVGRWGYIYDLGEAQISLIQKLNRKYDGSMEWEIYSFNAIFEGVESFEKRSEANKRIFRIILDYTKRQKKHA